MTRQFCVCNYNEVLVPVVDDGGVGVQDLLDSLNVLQLQVEAGEIEAVELDAVVARQVAEVIIRGSVESKSKFLYFFRKSRVYICT
jgi:hypothetical protein